MLPILATSFSDAIPHISQSLTTHFLPEIVLIVAACVVLLLDLIMREEESNWLAWPTTLGLVVALFLCMGKTSSWQSDLQLGTIKSTFLHMLAVDRFAMFFKLLFIFGSLMTVVLTYHYKPFKNQRMGEYYSLMFCSVVGMCLMASAIDFLMVFLAIELVSIPSYVLVGYQRQDRAGTEASLKYILYGAFSSGLMLFGVSIIYGLTGTTRFAGVTQLLNTANATNLTLLSFASLLTFGGFAYKLAAAPFHFWAPDVYQGAPTPITAWLSVTSKAAGIAAFVRFIASFSETGYTFGDFDWRLAISIIAAITMTIGNVQALMQENVKRMLAYSSVAHVGYILMGVTALGMNELSPSLLTECSQAYVFNGGAMGGSSGASAVAFYTFAYVWMNMGAFTVVIAISNRYGSENLSDFVGLGRKEPVLAVSMLVFIMAFIGLPPTVGFSGKLQLFMAVINDGTYWLAVVAGINTAISVYYYMKVVKAMFLDGNMDPAHSEPMAAESGLIAAAGLLALFPVIGFGLFFNTLGTFTQNLTMFVK